MQKNIRSLLERAECGEDLTEEETTDIYCDAPGVLRERDYFLEGLRKIVECGLDATTKDLRRIALRYLPDESKGE